MTTARRPASGAFAARVSRATAKAVHGPMSVAASPHDFARNKRPYVSGVMPSASFAGGIADATSAAVSPRG